MNAIFGLVILLGCFILLKTINSNLLQLGPNPQTSLSVSVIGVDEIPVLRLFSDGTCGFAGKDGKRIDAYSDLNVTLNPPTHRFVCGDAWPDDQTMRDDLAKVKSPLGVPLITILGAKCENYGQGAKDYTGPGPKTTCTSVWFNHDTAPKVLQALTDIATNCGCVLTITGGSEAWLHATHGPSVQVFDFQINDSLTNYITGKTDFPTANTWFNNAPTKNPTGNYLAEQPDATINTTGKHWHAVLK